MICEKCKNRTICKYYAFLLDAPMIVNIESCERFQTKQSNDFDLKITQFDRPVDVLQYKEPIDYNKFNIKQEEEIIEEDKEKIFVDLSEETHDNILSITDILMGGNNEPTEEN